ncbi:MAG TPA: hypothetical protein VG621_02355 [Candidatus Paceibacterota bacterium]|nr:hypothetical protein [Candidatus Paceibacterota bacterium]
MVAYKISFNEYRAAILEDTDEAPSRTWKKKNIAGEIIITASGRSIWSKPFRDNITYKLFDFNVATNKRITALEIICLYKPKSDILEDVIITLISLRRYALGHSVEETLEATLRADERYASRTGGGVKRIQNPLYKNQGLIDKLRSQLQDIRK